MNKADREATMAHSLTRVREDVEAMRDGVDWKRRALAAEAMLAELAEVSDGSTMKRERNEARAEVARLREALERIDALDGMDGCTVGIAATALAATGGAA